MQFETIKRSRISRLTYPKLSLFHVTLNQSTPSIHLPPDISSDSDIKLMDLTYEENLCNELKARQASRLDMCKERGIRSKKADELEVMLADQRKSELERMKKEKALADRKEREAKEKEERAKLDAIEDSKKQNQKRANEFMSITGKSNLNKTLAYLSIFDFDLEKSLSSFFNKPENFDTLTGDGISADNDKAVSSFSNSSGRISSESMIDITLPNNKTSITAHHAHTWQFQAFSITASNPYRTFTDSQLQSLTLKDAGLHPMGQISVVLNRHH